MHVKTPALWPSWLVYRIRLTIQKVAYRLHVLALERANVHAAVKNLHNDLKLGNTVRTGYVDHYSEQTELAVRERYKALFDSGQETEVTFRARYVRDRIRQFIPPNATLLNFGCSYGWLEHQVPGMIGIDRSEASMQFNRVEFPQTTFIAGDVFEFLQHNRIDGLVHINIGVYFLPTFISKLYAAAKAAGARYLIGFEPSGISRETNSYYTYDLSLRQSVLFRGPMLLHNYPRLMLDAGFEVIHAEVVRPPHPENDYRSAFFLSKLLKTGPHDE